MTSELHTASEDLAQFIERIEASESDGELVKYRCALAEIIETDAGLRQALREVFHALLMRIEELERKVEEK